MTGVITNDPRLFRPARVVMDHPLVRSVGVTETDTLFRTPSGTSSWERFEDLYRSSRDDVYAYVVTLLRDPAAAEDVTALAFERAYRRRRTFDRRRGEERAWLFGIARNAALDELRRRRRTATLVTDPSEDAADADQRRRRRGRAAPHGGAGRAREAAGARAGDHRLEVPRRAVATPSWRACSGSASRTPARCCTARWRSSERPAMRLLDHDPIDPEIAATLDAIDATLAGEPVDARYAELGRDRAAARRPIGRSSRPSSRRSMDARVGRRFAPAPDSVAPGGAARRGRLARRFWRGGRRAGGRRRAGRRRSRSWPSQRRTALSMSSSTPPASAGSACRRRRRPPPGPRARPPALGSVAFAQPRLAHPRSGRVGAPPRPPRRSVRISRAASPSAADHRTQGRPVRAAHADRRRRAGSTTSRRRSST